VGGFYPVELADQVDTTCVVGRVNDPGIGPDIPGAQVCAPTDSVLRGFIKTGWIPLDADHEKNLFVFLVGPDVVMVRATCDDGTSKETDVVRLTGDSSKIGAASVEVCDATSVSTRFEALDSNLKVIGADTAMQ
jgi:hypothetical protein